VPALPLTYGGGVLMRCYLLKDGHILAVEFLASGSDQELIEQAHGHFERRAAERFEGFEVWDAARRVYTWPEQPAK